MCATPSVSPSTIFHHRTPPTSVTARWAQSRTDHSAGPNNPRMTVSKIPKSTLHACLDNVWLRPQSGQLQRKRVEHERGRHRSRGHDGWVPRSVLGGLCTISCSGPGRKACRPSRTSPRWLLAPSNLFWQSAHRLRSWPTLKVEIAAGAARVVDGCWGDASSGKSRRNVSMCSAARGGVASQRCNTSAELLDDVASVFTARGVSRAEAYVSIALR
jgi:hypothetical protein